jgi:uracil phosphoribosyltransferase
VRTPLETTTGHRVAGKKLVLVPILRAGLGMVDAISQLIPSARVGHIGLYRDHDTLQPVKYYFKIPAGEPDRLFLVLDPMLATGGSCVHTCRLLRDSVAGRITVVCVLAAPEGIDVLRDSGVADLLFTAAIDERLNDVGFILPGLGDAGDRQFGLA